MTTAGYELPFGKGKALATSGIAALLFGGWGVETILTLQDGPYFTPFLPGDPLDTGSAASQRPDLLRSPNLDPSARTITRWFDTAAFARPSGFVYGNAGRGIIQGPGIVNLDANVRRSFQIREQARLEFRLEMFNAPNHANFGLPGNQFGTPSFGVIGSALDPRQIQMALKLYF